MYGSYPSIAHRSTDLSIHLSIHLSVYRSIDPSINLSIQLWIYRSIYPSLWSLHHPYIYQSVHPPVRKLHQKYYITQSELGSSWLTQMKDDYNTRFALPPSYLFVLLDFRRTYFMNLGVILSTTIPFSTWTRLPADVTVSPASLCTRQLYSPLSSWVTPCFWYSLSVAPAIGSLSLIHWNLGAGFPTASQNKLRMPPWGVHRQAGGWSVILSWAEGDRSGKQTNYSDHGGDGLPKLIYSKRSIINTTKSDSGVRNGRGGGWLMLSLLLQDDFVNVLYVLMLLLEEVVDVWSDGGQE